MSQVPELPAAAVVARHDPYAPLRIASFRWFLISVVTMAMGAQIQGVVVAWQMYALTHDPLALGLVGLAEAAPFIGFALYAGHVADVRDRRGVALVALLVLFACAGALAAVSYWMLRRPAPAAGIRAGIYAIILVCGAARSFLLPARNALSVDVVPRALLPGSVAWRTGVWQVAAVVGPALGGVLYGWVGASASYAIAAALMAAAFVAVMRVRVGAPAVRPARGPLLASVREGLAFLVARPLFLSAMTLDLVAVLFGGAVAILPIFAEQILHVGPEGLGALRAAPAVGAVLMSAALALRAPPQRAGRTFLVAVALFGVFMVGFALSRWSWLSLALLAASGAADMLSIFFRSTLIQVKVPPAMVGRVSAVNQIFIGSSNEIGAFESGLTARLLGTVPSVVLGGLVTIGAACAAWNVRELREMDRIEG
jgi:MFS family permease